MIPASTLQSTPTPSVYSQRGSWNVALKYKSDSVSLLKSSSGSVSQQLKGLTRSAPLPQPLFQAPWLISLQLQCPGLVDWQPVGTLPPWDFAPSCSFCLGCGSSRQWLILLPPSGSCSAVTSVRASLTLYKIVSPSLLNFYPKQIFPSCILCTFPIYFLYCLPSALECKLHSGRDLFQFFAIIIFDINTIGLEQGGFKLRVPLIRGCFS